VVCAQAFLPCNGGELGFKLTEGCQCSNAALLRRASDRLGYGAGCTGAPGHGQVDTTVGIWVRLYTRPWLSTDPASAVSMVSTTPRASLASPIARGDSENVASDRLDVCVVGSYSTVSPGADACTVICCCATSDTD